MRKILAVLLASALLVAAIPAVTAETPGPITVTVFKGEPGDQPLEDNKIYKKIEFI